MPGYQAIFNAGAVHHDGSFHLFARGVRDGYCRSPGLGARFLDSISDVLVFTSENGCDYRFQQVLARGRDGERVAMTYTNLPEPESGKPWQIGVHRRAYADGRVAMIHRIQPNMQLAVFDSLDELWSSSDDYWDAHMANLDAHTIITPAARSAGQRGGSAARGDRRGPAALLPRASCLRRVHGERRAARRRHRPGQVPAGRPTAPARST